MSEGEFRAEMRYRMSLAVARAMLEEGAITKEEYSEIDTILLQKHRPILGTLLAGKTLSSTRLSSFPSSLSTASSSS